MTGYIVFAHGSSVESANEAVRSVARDLAQAGGYAHVVAAFLEGGRPDLSSAAGELAARGVSHVVVIPYFLTLGLHLQRDLPRLIERTRLDHPGLDIEVTAPLDGHPAMVVALLDRARASEKPGGTPDPSSPEGRAGPVPVSMDSARTTELRSAGAPPVSPKPEGRAGPVRVSMDPARTTELGSAGAPPVSAKPEGRAGPVRAYDSVCKPS